MRYPLHAQAALDAVANQRGIALITAIAMLAVMSILGAVLMTTSTSEIQLSGNYRNALESFYAADRAVTYASQFATEGGSNIDLYNDTDSTGTLYRDRITLNGGGLEQPPSPNPDEINTVKFISSGDPPVGSGYDPSTFEALYYQVHVVAAYPMTAVHPTRSEIITQVAKIRVK